jgi:hypothetical protein
MSNERRFAGRVLEANRALPKPGRANGENLIMFPLHRTKRYLQARMFRHGDDAGHCRNGLSAQEYREATTEDRATYRKWIFGMVAFYSVLLLMCGVVAVVTGVPADLTRVTTLSAQTAAAPSGRP